MKFVRWVRTLSCHFAFRQGEYYIGLDVSLELTAVCVVFSNVEPEGFAAVHFQDVDMMCEPI